MPSAIAKRDAAAKGSLPAVKRGRISERTWSDVRRAAQVAREEGVKLRVHHGVVDIIGVLKQPTKVPGKVVNKEQKKPAKPVEPTLPSTVGDETPPPPLSKRKEKSKQRLLVYQEKKRAELFAKKPYGKTPKGIARHEAVFQKRGHHSALAVAKLRWLLWRAWARYRPIFGGIALGYTSLREQYVHRRASKLYAAAFSLDPGKSGRPLAAWLRRATPMEQDTSSVGSQPPKRAKKSRGNRVRALPEA